MRHDYVDSTTTKRVCLSDQVLYLAFTNTTRHSSNSLWTKAINELPDEHKHGIDFTNSEKIDILRDLREKAENSRNHFMASRWKYTRKSGETVIMRDLFEKLVRWIDMFKEIGDLAVQYDPTHAALPWAGIRFVLQVSYIGLLK